MLSEVYARTEIHALLVRAVETPLLVAVVPESRSIHSRQSEPKGQGLARYMC